MKCATSRLSQRLQQELPGKVSSGVAMLICVAVATARVLCYLKNDNYYKYKLSSITSMVACEEVYYVEYYAIIGVLFFKMSEHFCVC